MSFPKNSINLIYIRAAIEAATGVRLTLKDVRRYLLEEGLITPEQARKEATIFRGYSEFYDYDYADTQEENDPAKELDFQHEAGKQNLRFGEGLG